jgi:hypothetical protein
MASTNDSITYAYTISSKKQKLSVQPNNMFHANSFLLINTQEKATFVQSSSRHQRRRKFCSSGDHDIEYITPTL